MSRRLPQQERAKALVDAVFEAGRQLLGQSRLDSVTARALAKRAGVSPGSLYQYFRGKDELFSALIERALAGQVKRFREEADTAQSVGELIPLVVDRALFYFFDTPWLQRLFVHTVSLQQISSVGKARRSVASVLASRVLQFDTVGDSLTQPGLEVRFEFLIHAIMGVFEAHAFEQFVVERDELRRQLIRLVEGYLGDLKPPPKRSLS
ncbi:MAG: TetR/AcrR family transcriptional regulator [Polyangiales bacterium]